MSRLPKWREELRAAEEKQAEQEAIEEGARQAVDRWVCDLCPEFSVIDLFTAVNHARVLGAHPVRSAEGAQAHKNIVEAGQAEVLLYAVAEARRKQQGAAA